MRTFWLTSFALCAAVLFGADAGAQQPAPPPSPPPGYGAPITLDQAKAAAAAAEAEMKQNGWNQVIAIVGTMGETIYLQKADLAPNGSIAVAQEKARTSALFRVPTKLFHDRLAGGETVVLGIPGVTPLAGAISIMVGGKVIGAIGISGATAAQDHQIATAGAAAVK